MQADGFDRPSQEEAEAAVRTLIRWAGRCEPGRGCLTQWQVMRSYRELFAGYDPIPANILERTSRRSAAMTSWSCCATSVS